jgi:hypothetical protein
MFHLFLEASGDRDRDRSYETHVPEKRTSSSRASSCLIFISSEDMLGAGAVTINAAVVVCATVDRMRQGEGRRELIHGNRARDIVTLGRLFYSLLP